MNAATLRAQYARNAVGLAALLRRAEATGKKANGFTAAQLAERLAEFQRLAVASDADLRAHFARPLTAVAR